MGRYFHDILIAVSTIIIVTRLAIESTSTQTLLLTGLKLFLAIPGLMISTMIYLTVIESITSSRILVEYRKRRYQVLKQREEQRKRSMELERK